MNELFTKAGQWLSELGINTKVFPAVLKIEKTCLVTLGLTESQLLAELRTVAESKRLYWGTVRPDSEWLFLESL